MTTPTDFSNLISFPETDSALGCPVCRFRACNYTLAVFSCSLNVRDNILIVGRPETFPYRSCVVGRQ